MTALAHTADTGLLVRGRTLSECLARVGAGLFALMFTVPTGARARRRLRVELDAESREALLVAWLEELLYRSEVAGLVLIEFDVEVAGRSLWARVGGVPVEAAETVGPVVKAVTWHALRLERRPGGWRARVIFDV